MASWEEAPDEPGSQKTPEAVRTVSTNGLRAEAIQMQSQIVTFDASYIILETEREVLKQNDEEF